MGVSYEMYSQVRERPYTATIAIPASVKATFSPNLGEPFVLQSAICALVVVRIGL
jgi:hypothetical protein